MITLISPLDDMLGRCIETKACNIAGANNWFVLGSDNVNYYMGYEAILWEKIEITDLLLLSVSWEVIKDYKEVLIRLLKQDVPKLVYIEGEYNSFVNMPVYKKKELINEIGATTVACLRTELFYFDSIFENVIALDEKFDIDYIKSQYKELNKDTILLPTSYSQSRYGEVNAIVSSKLPLQSVMLRSDFATNFQYTDKVIPLPWVSSPVYYNLLNKSIICINVDVRYTFGKTAIDCACLKVPYISQRSTCAAKVLDSIPIPAGATGEELLEISQHAIDGEFEEECELMYEQVEIFDKSIGREKILDYFGIEDF